MNRYIPILQTTKAIIFNNCQVYQQRRLAWLKKRHLPVIDPNRYNTDKSAVVSV